MPEYLIESISDISTKLNAVRKERKKDIEYNARFASIDVNIYIYIYINFN
jgi:hypothetical protein